MNSHLENLLPGIRAYAVATVMMMLSSCGSSPESNEPAANSLRQTSLGILIGKESAAHTHAWLGVPYASPPVGKFRWRTPNPAKPWAKSYHALSAGNHCPQPGSPFGVVDPEYYGKLIGDEDCLYLNIWSPRFTPESVPKHDSRLPVMVWIHGGGNAYGHGSAWDGAELAGRQNLIVITINYRLGPLGWFHHPDLNASSEPEDWSGNYGTLDIIAALRWVQNHISAFGGNPDRVTIFGESAGGANIASILVSPLAKGLFHGAIIQSGSTYASSLHHASHYVDAQEPGHRNSSREIVLKLLMHGGLAENRDAAKNLAEAMSATQLDTFLRSRSIRELFNVYLPNFEQGLLDLPRILSDGHVLPAGHLINSLGKPGLYNNVPVILGSNKDESKLFMANDKRLVSRLFNIPFRVKNPDEYQRLSEYATAAWKAAGVDEPAMALAHAQPLDVYAYRWDWDEEGQFLFMDLSFLLGAAHALEVPFVFGKFDIFPQNEQIFTKENEPGRKKLSESMMSYWAEFAYTGKPGQGRDGRLPEWYPYSPDETRDRLLILDTESDGGIRMSPELVTTRLIIDRLARDRFLDSQQKLCAMFNTVFDRRWTENETVEIARRRIGNGGCVDMMVDTNAP